MKIDRYTKLTLLLLAITTMMSNVAIVTVIPHFKDIFHDEANIELLARLMITIPSLMIAILAPFLGHLVYKVGKRRSAIFALILFGCAGSGGLYLDTIEMLLFSRGLLGIAIASLMIITTSLVGDYFQGEERHKFMGLQSAFTSIGGVIFVVGGGILSDMDWRYPFGIYLIGFALLFFATRYIVEIGQEQTMNPIEEPPVNLYFIYLLAFILMMVFYILPTQMPFLMINHFGATGTLTGAIISSAFVFHALGSISFSHLKKRFSFAFIYLIGMMIIGIGFIFIGIIDNVYLFFITAPMMGFGGGILMTNITAWMLSLAHHKKRVKNSGYLTSAFFMGQFFSPIVTMPLVTIFGVQHLFVIMGCILICSVVVAKSFMRSDHP
jgi:MFS family permease